ncbi:MAG: hypothetical protein ACP5O8_04330 [Candidatus Aenigmatarchaeota archaeon]
MGYILELSFLDVALIGIILSIILEIYKHFKDYSKFSFTHSPSILRFLFTTFLCGIGLFIAVIVAFISMNIGILIASIVFIYLSFSFFEVVFSKIPIEKGSTRVGGVVEEVKPIFLNSPTPVKNVFSRKKIPKRPINLKRYIENKNNQNVLIAGSSGTGKTFLSRYLLETLTRIKK